MKKAWKTEGLHADARSRTEIEAPGSTDGESHVPEICRALCSLVDDLSMPKE